MKAKTLSIILICSLAFNLAVIGTFVFRQCYDSGYAQRVAHFDPDEPPFMGNMMLDQQQKEQMKKLMGEFRDVNNKNRRLIFDLEDELMQLLRQPDYDSVKADSLIERIGQLRMNQSKQAIKHFRKFNKFLSPEQQEHFHNMIMERPGKREARFHRWRESRGKRMIHPEINPDSADRKR